MNRVTFDPRPALPSQQDDSCAVNRRGFLLGSLAAGFALAAQPLAAAPIQTDLNGLQDGVLQMPVPGGTMPVYYAAPAGSGPFPVVIVIQEIFGVHEHIRDLCRRLAKQGYFAASAELYVRQGDVAPLKTIPEIIGTVVSKVPDDQVRTDLDQLIHVLAATGLADTNRLGVTGFCWGGRMTYLYALHNPRVKAAVAWYGLLAAPMWNPKADSVLAKVKDLKVPVLGLFAEKDGFIPVKDVDALKSALPAASGSQVVLYPGVDHGFNADYRPTYNKAAATDGWEKMLGWFAAHGVK